MKRIGTNKRVFLYFSHWGRKGYSVFVSLGREVRITQLSLHMYAMVLLKAAAKGVIVNMDHVLKVVLPISRREVPETECGKTRGVVYPQVNDLKINGKGYAA